MKKMKFVKHFNAIGYRNDVSLWSKEAYFVQIQLLECWRSVEETKDIKKRNDEIAKTKVSTCRVSTLWCAILMLGTSHCTWPLTCLGPLTNIKITLGFSYLDKSEGRWSEHFFFVHLLLFTPQKNVIKQHLSLSSNFLNCLFLFLLKSITFINFLGKCIL